MVPGKPRIKSVCWLAGTWATGPTVFIIVLFELFVASFLDSKIAHKCKKKNYLNFQEKINRNKLFSNLQNLEIKKKRRLAEKMRREHF